MTSTVFVGYADFSHLDAKHVLLAEALLNQVPIRIESPWNPGEGGTGKETPWIHGPLPLPFWGSGDFLSETPVLPRI